VTKSYGRKTLNLKGVQIHEAGMNKKNKNIYEGRKRR
jgi:hypothetical protein